MIEIPFLTFGGLATALVFENHVGGDLDALARASYAQDPEAFRKLILEALRTHYPATAERVDPAAFDLAGGPLDLLQGGVTPAVRRSCIVLDDGTLALSLGDVKATVDPLLGQGANMASHAAWVLGQEIVAQDVYDSRFVEQVERKRDDRVLASDHFAGRPAAEPPQFTIRDRVPTLADCLAWFECEVIERFEIHDHTVFVARVLSCGTNGGSPLMFFGSTYHRPGWRCPIDSAARLQATPLVSGNA